MIRSGKPAAEINAANARVGIARCRADLHRAILVAGMWPWIEVVHNEPRTDDMRALVDAMEGRR